MKYELARINWREDTLELQKKVQELERMSVRVRIGDDAATAKVTQARITCAADGNEAWAEVLVRVPSPPSNAALRALRVVEEWVGRTATFDSITG
jgi:hypothetical protein